MNHSVRSSFVVASGLLGVAAMCATLVVGVPAALGAGPDTRYDIVATESPDPVDPSDLSGCPPVPEGAFQPPCIYSRFAERLSDAADVTGDGVRDVFASTWIQDIPPSEVGGVRNNNAGRISLINGGTQQVVYSVNPEPQVDGNFGFYISVPGDVGPTRDGREDLVSGASGYDVGTGPDGAGCTRPATPEPNQCNENQGRGYVLSGPTGELIAKLDNFNAQPGGGFSSRLGAAGDVNGDGVQDILAAAQANDFPAGCGINPATGSPWPAAQFPAGCSANEGEVFVVDGTDFSLIRSLRIPAEDRRPLPCRSSCGSLGGGPQNVGDVGPLTVQSDGTLGGDGVPDHLVPATSYNPDSTRNGRIYIFSGADGEVLSRIDQPSPDTNGFFGLQDLDRGGPGDLNDDGVPELYGTGFLQNGPNDEDAAGRSWVFDGEPSILEGRGVLLREHVDPFLGPNRAFGWALSQTDYNKDGRIDSYVSNLQGQNTTTSIFDGRNGLLLKNLGLGPLGQRSLPVLGGQGSTNNGSSLGWSSRAPGDLNGDGEPDYVAAAPYQDVNGNRDQGKVFFFLSNTGTAPPAGPPASPIPQAGPSAFAGCPILTANVVRATPASDSITGTVLGDRIFAGTGNDEADGLAGNDCIDLGPGTDDGQGGLGNDLIVGGLGADRISGGSGDDRLRGNAGGDRINAGRGNDRAFGDAGDDVILGSFGNDRLHGVSGNDRLVGSRGRDRINGGSGRDLIAGGSSDDVVRGDRGNDRINGNSGDDRLFGNSGNDLITGGAGRDVISAGAGNDRVDVRDGQRDRVNCGLGRDPVIADRSDVVARNCERIRRS
ncbi:MAG: hypothetical protein M3433_02110 [Actinomycetota bacterium]|nr:hypothetical protein [Actinomycetota bacterium]